jgi:hypothetical protein
MQAFVDQRAVELAQGIARDASPRFVWVKHAIFHVEHAHERGRFLEKLHEIETGSGVLVFHRAPSAYQSLWIRVGNLAAANAPCHNRAMQTPFTRRSIDGDRSGAIIVILLACLSCTGCDDFSRFSTRPSEAYCGAITLGSAFRAGLSPRVQMRLQLDADALDGPDSPGRVATFEAPTSELPERRMLDEALLRPIPPLAHDPLSRFEMGDGRERNAVYAVSPRDPVAAGMLAFLSLRSDDGIEVRLLRPGTDAAVDDDNRKLIFGLFSLVKREGSCGF